MRKLKKKKLGARILKIFIVIVVVVVLYFNLKKVKTFVCHTVNLITSKIQARITLKIIGKNIHHLLCLVIHMITIVDVKTVLNRC